MFMASQRYPDTGDVYLQAYIGAGIDINALKASNLRFEDVLLPCSYVLIRNLARSKQTDARLTFRKYDLVMSGLPDDGTRIIILENYCSRSCE
jgi:hypothetical protein